MQNKKIAAFFDFDGTLYNGVITFDFIKFAVRKGNLRFSQALKLPLFLYYYALDKFALVNRYEVNKKIYKKIYGWNARQLETASEDFFKSKINKKLNPAIIDVLNKHKSKKHNTVVVTSALKQIINPLRHYINVDDIIATEVEISNGVYTSRIKKLPIGYARVDVILDYCNKNNIDLSRSYAYSDHYSDVPLLKAVGNPIAVKPESALKKYAVKRGWRVI